MIRWTVSKAMLVGIAILMGAQVLYVGVLMKVSHYELLRLALLGSPAIAALAAAYLAPRRKIGVGLSMAIYGAAMGILFGLVYQYFGLYVDQIGGMLTTFLILLAYNGVLSLVGGAAGTLLSQWCGLVASNQR